MTKSSEELRRAALTLAEVLERRDVSDPLLAEASEILRPLLEAAQNQGPVPGRLPRENFFFGMHDWELGSQYLGDSELMNAIGAFDAALRLAGTP
jgi:hypothetical protein